MEVLLFLLILLQLTFAVIIFRNLIHPIIILKLFCALSAFVLIFYSKIWGLYISLDTVIIFTTGLIWVDFGYSIVAFINNKKKKEASLKEEEPAESQNNEFSIAGTLVILSFMIFTIIAFLNYGKAYINFGNGIENFSKSVIMLKVARRGGELSELGFWQYAITGSSIIGIVYTYICIKEFIVNGFNKRFLIFSLPVIVTFILYYMTGRRSFLLNVILIILILVYKYAIRRYGNIPLKFQMKFFSWSIIMFGVFYLFFVTAGKLLLKGSNVGVDFFNSFAIYLSGGIVAFDKVHEYYNLTSEIFGQNFLRIFYKILNIIPGANFPTEDTIKESLYAGNEFVTNVYTVNLPYIADFGYLGVIIGNLFIGIFYGFLYFKSKKEDEIGFWNLLYAFFLTSLLSYTGSEKYFVPMTINIQYLLLFYVLLKTPLLYKKVRAKNKKG